MSLRILRAKAVPGFPPQVFFCHRYAPSQWDMPVLNTPSHPLRPKVIEGIATAPQDVLHWDFETGPSVKTLPKATQRTKLCSRWGTAFRAALSRSGYAKDGSNLMEATPRPGLVGRLRVVVNRGQGMDSTSQDLFKSCCTLIAAVEGFQRR